MKIERTGIVLYTENYRDCVAFYRDALNLAILFEREEEELVCFDFGGSYLMVEKEGSAKPSGKGPAENPTCLRFNVKDVKAYVDILKNKGVDVDYQEHSWGVVAKFFDPDGNLCALRDELAFKAQIES